jgi:hypothetical protein
MERMNGRADEDVVTDFDQTNDQVHGLEGDDGGSLASPAPAERDDDADGPDEWVPMDPQQRGVVWPLAAGLAEDDAEDRSGAGESDSDPAVTSYSEEGTA